MGGRLSAGAHRVSRERRSCRAEQLQEEGSRVDECGRTERTESAGLWTEAGRELKAMRSGCTWGPLWSCKAAKISFCPTFLPGDDQDLLHAKQKSHAVLMTLNHRFNQ